MRSSTIFKLTVVALVILAILAILPYFQRWLPKSPAQTPSTPIPTIPTVRANAYATVAVAGTQWGKSTCYIGAVEGSSRFNISDLKDRGINPYHISGGRSA